MGDEVPGAPVWQIRTKKWGGLCGECEACGVTPAKKEETLVFHAPRFVHACAVIAAPTYWPALVGTRAAVSTTASSLTVDFVEVLCEGREVLGYGV